MKVNGIKCCICGDKVFSRARHDMRYCTCGQSAVDGGQSDYFKVTGTRCEPCTINVPNVTNKILYDDWNTRKNKYGLIKGKVVFHRKVPPIIKNTSVPRWLLVKLITILVKSRKLTNDINDKLSGWVLRRLK